MTVALVGSDDSVAIGHVGDSRAYLLRDGTLEQLTDDHSLVAELVRRGELSPAEAEVHPQRSVITRALGTDPDVDVDVFSVAGRGGRRLPALLATGSRRWSTRDDDRARSSSATAATSRRATRELIQGRERRRRRRQHHRRAVRDSPTGTQRRRRAGEHGSPSRGASTAASRGRRGHAPSRGRRRAAAEPRSTRTVFAAP